MAGLQGLLEEIRALEKKVSEEISREAEEFGYSLKKGRARFSQEVRERHRSLRTDLRDYIRGASLRILLTGPVIYSLVVPLVFLDLVATLYQWACFPIYRIPRVRRRDFIIYDRQHLDYLNIIEKFHCLYCGYANGMLAYAAEIAGRTEQYWCPIKHAGRIRNAHSRYYRFFSYGDGERYATELQSLRRQFGDLERAATSQSPPAKG
ncbi:MAG: hypothetical protein ACWGOV_00320 [Acidiferrobacterales bacterium]